MFDFDARAWSDENMLDSWSESGKGSFSRLPVRHFSYFRHVLIHPPNFFFFDTHPTTDRQRWDVPLRTCKTFILWTVFPSVTHFLISFVGPVSRLRVSCHQKCGRLSTHKCFLRPFPRNVQNCHLTILTFPEMIYVNLGQMVLSFLLFLEFGVFQTKLQLQRFQE